MRNPLTLLALPLMFTLSAATDCYFPNGTKHNDLEFKACPFTNNGVSMCCGFNRTIPFGGNPDDGHTADQCLANGLCMNQGLISRDNGDSTSKLTYWRNTCTTPGWNGCLDVCISGYDSTIHMTPCDGTPTSETWCCGVGNTTCCNSDSAINIPAQFGKQVASATTRVPTTTGTNHSSSSSLSSSSTGLSDGAKAGIGVGAAVGGIAIIVILAFWIIRQRRQLKQHQEQLNKIDEFKIVGAVAASGYQGYATVQSPGEMNRQGMAHEKAAGVEDTRHELPAESSRRR